MVSFVLEAGQLQCYIQANLEKVEPGEDIPRAREFVEALDSVIDQLSDYFCGATLSTELAIDGKIVVDSAVDEFPEIIGE